MAVALALIVALVAFGVYAYGGNGAAVGGAGSSATATPALTPAKSQRVFTIDPSVSSASFEMHEALFGNPNTVLGKTNQVSGQILINSTDPSKSQLGPIRVDLSALTTDSDMRNRTLQNRILETGEPANRYATFTATSFQGLPSTSPGSQLVRFKVTGNLTIHQVTKIETFDVLFTFNSDKQVTGSANATVRYEDFNLAIPDVPSVTDVSDTVVLTLNFTARAA
jgi:polyisoprenoid-binding protein YceI